MPRQLSTLIRLGGKFQSLDAYQPMCFLSFPDPIPISRAILTQLLCLLVVWLSPLQIRALLSILHVKRTNRILLCLRVPDTEHHILGR